MDVAIVRQQAALRGMVKVRTLVDAGLLTRSAAENLWAPSVPPIQLDIFPDVAHRSYSQMAVKMDNAHGAIFAVDAAQKRESNGMVATQSDDSREGLALFRDTRLLRICCRHS